MLTETAEQALPRLIRHMIVFDTFCDWYDSCLEAAGAGVRCCFYFIILPCNMSVACGFYGSPEQAVKRQTSGLKEYDAVHYYFVSHMFVEVHTRTMRHANYEYCLDSFL